MAMILGQHNLQQTEIQSQPCPQCGTGMPVYREYVTWCDKCGWNVLPYDRDKPKNLFEVLYLQLSWRLGKHQFDKLVAAPDLRPSITPNKVIALAVAVVIHSFTLFMLFVGINFVVQTWFNPLPFLLGIGLIATGWFLRPHLPQIDKEDREDLVLSEEYPVLYAMFDRVADAIGAKPVRQIMLADSFNAAFARVGWQQSDVIELGLPLFSVLEPQERVALVAHEIGHGANGDSSRSLIIGSALYSLNRWYVLLHPDRIWDPDGGILHIISSFFANLIMFVLSQIAKFWLILLSHLLFRDMQRAEYLADNMAAEAAGTNGVLGLMRKLHSVDTVQMSVTRFYLNNSKSSLFDTLKAQVRNIPPREIARIERVERLLASRLDATHPPTAYRIDLLNARPVRTPKVLLSDEENQAIDAELARVRAEISGAYNRGFHESKLLLINLIIIFSFFRRRPERQRIRHLYHAAICQPASNKDRDSRDWRIIDSRVPTRSSL